MPEHEEGSAILAEEDLLFEEDILRNAYSLKYWWRYIDAKRYAKPRAKCLIYERALKYLPGSYKLWHQYLNYRKELVRGRKLTSGSYEAVNNAYERAMVFMHKMPRIWLDYLQFLVDQKQFTRTRHTFDRALRSLAVTQHDRIWPLYLKFARETGVVETAVRVYRRYMKFEPENVEDYISFLLGVGRIGEVCIQLANILNREDFVSIHGKSHHELWLQLTDLMSKNPDKVTGLRVDAIIRGGIQRFTDEVGHLWCALADYYIRQAQFEMARDVYEESITSVMTVRDFSMIFDAYSQFEESMISAKMEILEAPDQQLDETKLAEEQLDLEIRLARLEALMERRRELLSSVLLRQNPHNVHEWHKRVKLFTKTPAKVIHTYATAVKTVDPSQAVGKLNSLWMAFAKYYESHKDLNNARVILKKATHVNYKVVEDLAAVWCEWVEMELRHQNYKEAINVIQQATAIPPAFKRSKKDETTGPVQNRLYKNTRLWSLHADLEESVGTFESTKSVYEQIIDLRIVTPQIIINYGAFLEENKYFEDSFKAYEKGVNVFNYPYVLDIWQVYLTKFVDRYQGRKLERARDLFEQALSNCPSKQCLWLYRKYGQLEEDFGLARHAMTIYDRMCKNVLPEQKYEQYIHYIARASEYFGVMKTRDIYEQAISSLPDKNIKDICVRFANLERTLGEIDRARAIYVHAAQNVDPRQFPNFWKDWNGFEVQHGNEDTFREMLRIKRSVLAQFTQSNFVTGGTLSDAAPAAAAEEVGQKRERGDEMSQLEQQADAVMQETEQEGNPSKQARREGEMTEEEAAAVAENDGSGEVVEVDETRSREEAPVSEVQQMQVPEAVFGSAAGLAGDSKDGGKMGALERIKRARG